jgi:nucleoside 2-deoxyribosyltransferase
MSGPSVCPVCLDLHSSNAKITTGHGGSRIDCQNCGVFGCSEEAWDDILDPQSSAGCKLTAVQRSKLSHRIRAAGADGTSKWPKINFDFVERFVADGFPGPSPAQQASNLIRYIGDEVSKTGERLEQLPINLFAIIGSPNPDFAGELTLELIRKGTLVGNERRAMGISPSALYVGLTLKGWEDYQAEISGKFAGKYGFIALKFGDSILDPFVQNEVKPAVKIGIGFDLIDLRDVSQAGVIDNIMRAQIRDSAFVLVDLTHDNSGAYWEAGYAEGLGKPVIYLCEKSKFDQAKTHFDTNHCTTVIWERDNVEQFKNELIATLRRSLNLFG